MITPLQNLLRRRVKTPAEVAAAAQRGRVAVWRWAKGESFPDPEVVPRLIELFGDGVLDFNGCYLATVDDEAQT